MANVDEILAKYGSSSEELDEQVENDDEVLDTQKSRDEETQEIEDEVEQPKEKMLPQSKVDKIIKERLEREKGKFTDYEDLKEIAESLKSYGYSGSVKEIREQLKQAVDVANKEKELEGLQEEADKHGTSPELLKEIKDLKKELSDIKTKEKEAQEAKEKEAREKEEADKEFNRQVEELNEKYPDVSIQELAKDKKFNRFASRSNPNLTLTEVYEDYVELVGETEANALAKFTSKQNRSTASGKSRGDATGGTYGLTPEQQKLARDNGMTNKEYSSRLSRIKR